MDCCKCDETAQHAITVREGTPPDPFDEKMKDRDKSGVHVYGFCAMHWHKLRGFLGHV